MKIFKRIANNHSLFQPQQQTQAADVQEDKFNLPYVEDTTENLWGMLRFRKIRSTFYIENT